MRQHLLHTPIALRPVPRSVLLRIPLLEVVESWQRFGCQLLLLDAVGKVVVARGVEGAEVIV